MVPNALFLLPSRGTSQNLLAFALAHIRKNRANPPR
jgi:hypothetical protein